MPQNTTEVTVEEEQLDARLSELLHQMNQQYQSCPPHTVRVP